MIILGFLTIITNALRGYDRVARAPLPGAG
jgi:hypothetical protein